MPLLPDLQLVCPEHSTHVLIDEEDIFRCPTSGHRWIILWGNGLVRLP
jgi:hypothetical protein